MKKAWPKLLALALAASTGACGANHPLSSSGMGAPAGTGGVGGTGPGAARTGVAGTGTGVAGATGTGVAGTTGTGIAGATGTGVAGAGPSPLQISGAEALRRLAAVLWNEQPDDDLMQQAAAGRFVTRADLESVVRRMLDDPRATAGVGAFYRWWLDLDDVAKLSKDRQLFPSFTPELQADMANETARFAVDVTLGMNGTYQTLLTAPFTYLNARLADVYGVAGVTGDELRLLPVDEQQRAGLLTQPALQSLGSYETRNSPSARGAQIDRRFFCQQVPPKPAGIPPIPPPPSGVTLREALTTETAQVPCSVCHASFDGAGLAFETFDAMGRFRTTDNGAPVDVSGLSLINVYPSAIGFTGPVMLASLVARSDVAEQCMTRQWLAFVLNKNFPDISDAFVDEAYPTFVASGFNLKELIVAVLTSDVFLSL